MTEFNWTEKRVLVTGATGLIGSWLVKDLLNKGAKVVCLIRDIDYQTEFYRSKDYLKTTIVNGALEDMDTIERAVNEYEIELIFHLGAQTIVGAAQREPLQTFESNIRGTYHILEASRKHSELVKGVIVASSDKAYGIAKELPYNEDHRLEGTHPYDVSKSCADLISQSYYHSYGLPVSISRCGNVYGGGDLNWSRIVPGTIRSLLDDQRPVLRSDGNHIRDYIYVKDVVAAYSLQAASLLMNKTAGESFNFSNESRTTVIEIVNEIISIMGKENIKPEILNMKLKEIPEQSLSAKKAHKILDWHPKFDLRKGLSETVNWYYNYFEKSE